MLPCFSEIFYTDKKIKITVMQFWNDEGNAELLPEQLFCLLMNRNKIHTPINKPIDPVFADIQS